MTQPVAWVEPEQTAPVGLRLVACGAVSAVFPVREAGRPRARLALQNLLYRAFDPVLAANRVKAPSVDALYLGLKRVHGLCQISMVLSPRQPAASRVGDNGRAYLHHARDLHISKVHAAGTVGRILGSLREPVHTEAMQTQLIRSGCAAHILTSRQNFRRTMEALRDHALLCTSDQEDIDVTITGPWPPSAVLWSSCNARS